MTRNEQFKLVPKLIKKAIENGWEEGEYFQKLYAMYPANFGRNYLTDNFFRIIITNLEFAKAFFGETQYQFHLSQMILLKDPLDYFVQFENLDT